jgi:UDP-glucose 4-epimerase
MEAVAIKTVFITGGLGYLGGRLSKYLLGAGYRVIIGSSRKDSELPYELKDCSLVYTNFDDISALSNVCRKVDCIIHLAAVNARQSQDDPQLAIKVNGIGSYNLIQASVKSNVKYFIYFSTAHIYGLPLTGKIDESTLPKPAHPYAITHRLAEDFLLESIGSQNVKGCIVRLSNSIGPPLTKETNCWMLFVNNACKQAIVDRRIVINFNPYSKRDFVPISSICKITEYFLSSYMTEDYPIFNVGSGVSHTLLQIAEIISDRCKELLGFSPEIIFDESNAIDNTSLEYKINKLTTVMGYTINSSLESSIDEVLEFCNVEFG